MDQPTHRSSKVVSRLLIALTALAVCIPTSAQTSEFTLRPDGQWEQTRTPTPGSDEATIAEGRRLLADRRPGAARDLIQVWLKKNDPKSTGTNIWIPDALLIRADSLVAMGLEFKSLYDYEAVIRRFPQSDAFVRAIEREMAIAEEYANGLKRRRFGIRIGDTSEIAAELFIRAQERMPGSVLAERAGIELADLYYRRREMDLAAEAYDLYLQNFPNGPNRTKAMQRRIYANIAGFKGPSYNAVGLIDAREQIRRFANEMPLEAARLGIDSALLARVDESLALQKLTTAKWHITRKEYPAARFVLRRLLKDHPQSGAASDALQIMIDRGWMTIDAPVTGSAQEPTP